MPNLQRLFALSRDLMCVAGLDGYFKQFEGLETEEDARTHASGIDLWLRRNTGTFTGWLGYSLSWVWTVRGQDRDADSFRGRHLVNAGVSGPVVGRGLFDVRVSYGAGLPYTAIPEPEVASPAFAMLGGEAATGVSPAWDSVRIDGRPESVSLFDWRSSSRLYCPRNHE